MRTNYCLANWGLSTWLALELEIQSLEMQIRCYITSTTTTTTTISCICPPWIRGSSRDQGFQVSATCCRDDTWGLPQGLALGPQIRSLGIRGFERYGFAGRHGIVAEKGWWACGRWRKLAEITPEEYKSPRRGRAQREEGLKFK